ncbi:MAG: hypothetical protein FWG31_02985 [Oscillospiraceae bacterium]|nr:hypothetical protein [Oscillospiraceae bacterium]
MDNFDEKLNKLLQDPEALARVAELAKGFQQQRDAAPSGAPGPAPAASGGGVDPGILGALSGLDPKTLSGIAGLLGDLTAKDDRRSQLLSALRPYVRTQRQEKMDRAVQLIQLSKVARRALGMFGGS